jgi:PPOX class probable F420-dependent enzyme
MAADVVNSRYVSLRTRKRNGDTVDTPVWIAPLDDGSACFTTEASAGKVKRIRNFPEVTLRPCDMRGRVPEGAATVSATARVVTGAEFDAVKAAVKRKYGWQFRMIEITGSIRDLFRRGDAADCGIVLTFDEPSHA